MQHNSPREGLQCHLSVTEGLFIVKHPKLVSAPTLCEGVSKQPERSSLLAEQQTPSTSLHIIT